MMLTRTPREENNVQRQKINAKLLKIGVLGIQNIKNKTEDEAMNALLHAKVVRLDNRQIKEIDGLELVDKVERIYLQGNYIEKIENLDFHTKLTWLNLSDNYICKIENLKHLVNLKVLDLSLNNISSENADFSNLPKKKLTVLNVYGNPCSNMENNANYRSKIRQQCPQILALDGGRMDIDVSTLIGEGEENVEEDEEATEGDEGDDLYQCDGTKCERSIIYGARYQVTLNEGGKVLDLCAGCAYERAIENQGNESMEKITIAQKTSPIAANRKDRALNTNARGVNFNETVLKLNIQQQQARNQFQSKRTEILKRSNERLLKLQQQQEIKNGNKSDEITLNKESEDDHEKNRTVSNMSSKSESKSEEKKDAASNLKK